MYFKKNKSKQKTKRCKKKEDKILTSLISESLMYEFFNYIKKKCIMFPRFKTDLFLLICREKNMCTDEVTLV